MLDKQVGRDITFCNAIRKKKEERRKKKEYRRRGKNVHTHFFLFFLVNIRGFMKRKIFVTGNVNLCDVSAEKALVSGTTTLIGRDFYKLPATMMMEGAYTPYVENVSEQTSLFFNGSELGKSTQSWNGRPVSINHPDGQETCNSPENYQKQWIGFIFNAKYDASEKKLSSEVWVDADRGGRIIDLVNSGKNMDISIGAYGDIIPSNGVAQNGVEYNYEMKNITGDHLAVLPDGIGACSWKDGCGIRANDAFAEAKAPIEEASEVSENNNLCSSFQTNNGAMLLSFASGDQEYHPIEEARTPSFDGVEDVSLSGSHTVSWRINGFGLDKFIFGYGKFAGGEDAPGTEVHDLSEGAKQWIASKTLLGDPKANTFNGLIVFPVVNPSTNKLNTNALMNVLSGSGQLADLSSAAIMSARDMAQSLIFNQLDKTGDLSDMSSIAAILDKSRTPSYDGTETISWGSVGKDLEEYLAGYYKHTGKKKEEDSRVSALSSSAKRWIASKTLLGDPSAITIRDLIFFPVVNPSTNKLNAGALRAVLSGRGAQAAISSSAKDSSMKKADALLNKEFKKGEESMSAKEKVDVKACCDGTLDDGGKAQVEASSSHESKVPDGGFSMDDWLTKLPEPARNYMVNSMKNYEETKAKHINKIVSCNLSDFCEKELHKISDMKTLEHIASLVDAANAKVMPAEIVQHGVNDFQIKGGAVKANEVASYAKFKDIEWGN